MVSDEPVYTPQNMLSAETDTCTRALLLPDPSQETPKSSVAQGPYTGDSPTSRNEFGHDSAPSQL